MYRDFDVLFERVGELSSGDPVWPFVSTQVREVFGAGEVSPARGLALSSLVIAKSANADFKLAEFGAQRALALARMSNDGSAARAALQALLECARANGRHETALRFARELRAAGDATALAEEIELLELVDDVAAGRKLLENARDRSGHEHGWAPRAAVAELRHQYAFGSLNDAHTIALRILAGTVQSHGGRDVFAAHIMLGRVAQLRGDCALAHHHLASAKTPECRTDEWPAMLTLTRASLAVCEGDVAAAVDLFRSVVRRTSTSGRLPCWLPSWLVEGTRLAVDCRDAEMSRQIAAFAQAMHERTPISKTNAAVAVQTQGLINDDVELLGDAVQLARNSPRARVIGEALLDHGRALLAHERKREAITALDAAWDAFNSIGARGPAILVERHLTHVGVRRRKWSSGANRPLAGWGALTETERRVARLIGEGHTSNSAASLLGSAPNTVRTQVRSILGKLGITSRVHLARMVNNEAPKLPEARPTEHIGR